jgi:hypothetical protein
VGSSRNQLRHLEEAKHAKSSVSCRRCCCTDRNTAYGLPAWGAACSSFVGGFGFIPILTATSGGFSCEVGQLTFSDITVTNSPGSVVFGFIPYQQNGEFGLQLNYGLVAQGGSIADLSWQMNVVAAPGVLINDVFAQLTGTITFFAGSAVLGEDVFEKGTTPPDSNLLAHIDLSLPAPPGKSSDTKFFTPVAAVHVFKDQANISTRASDGLISTSLLTNAFSVVPVPGPIAGAGLPGLVIALGGLVGLARSRRQRIV